MQKKTVNVKCVFCVALISETKTMTELCSHRQVFVSLVRYYRKLNRHILMKLSPNFTKIRYADLKLSHIDGKKHQRLKTIFFCNFSPRTCLQMTKAELLHCKSTQNFCPRQTL